MFCANCGKPHKADHKFCSKCGQLLPTTVLEKADTEPNPAPSSPGRVTEPAAEGQMPTAAQSGACQSYPVRKAPPYAIFASQALGSALFGSVVAFNIANDCARGLWRSTTSTLIAGTIAIVLTQRTFCEWINLRQSESKNSSSFRGKLLSRCIFFALLFLVTAAIVGSAIGKNGQQSEQMATDFQRMSGVGDRISKARNAAARTVPAQIEMYKSIEADVREFQSILSRLRAELDVYDRKFPNQHEETARSIHSIDVGLRRASLIQQQITLAREIEPLDPAPQWSAWQARMEPLLQDEDALNKTK